MTGPSNRVHRQAFVRCCQRAEVSHAVGYHSTDRDSIEHVQRRNPRTETVDWDTQLITSKYLPAPSDSDSTTVDKPPKIRSTASQMSRGVKLFLSLAIAMLLGCAIGTWVLKGTTQSTTAADWFLWVCGSDKTWEEYQRDQISKGNARLKDDEMT